MKTWFCTAFHPAVTFCALTRTYRTFPAFDHHSHISLGFFQPETREIDPGKLAALRAIARRPCFLTPRLFNYSQPASKIHSNLSATHLKGARRRHRLSHHTLNRTACFQSKPPGVSAFPFTTGAISHTGARPPSRALNPNRPAARFPFTKGAAPRSQHRSILTSTRLYKCGINRLVSYKQTLQQI
jgi:hypothetical protein